MSLEISEALAELCINQLRSKTIFKNCRISYELQDDFRFLLISVFVDDAQFFSRVDFRGAAELVDDLVPGRIGEYSWMINFFGDGAIFDSYFGGDLLSPKSGL